MASGITVATPVDYLLSLRKVRHWRPFISQKIKCRGAGSRIAADQ
jgi:hypothetical protein